MGAGSAACCCKGWKYHNSTIDSMHASKIGEDEPVNSTNSNKADNNQISRNKYFQIPSEIVKKKGLWDKKSYKVTSPFIVDLSRYRECAGNNKRENKSPKKVSNKMLEEISCSRSIPILDMMRSYKYNENIAGYVSCALDRVIGLWSAHSLSEIGAFKSPIAICRIIQLFDGTIAAGKANGEITLFSLPHFIIIATFSNSQYGGSYISALEQLSHTELVSGGGKNSGDILIWDLTTHDVTEILRKHKRSISSLRICNKYLFSGSHDGKVIMWEISKRIAIKSINTNHPIVGLVELPPDLYDDMPLILVLCEKTEDQLLYWDLNTDETRPLYPRIPKISACSPITPNLVALGTASGLLAIYNISDGNIQDSFHIHQGRVVNINYAGDGMLVTSSWDRTIKIIDIQGNIVAQNEEHLESINDLITIYYPPE